MKNDQLSLSASNPFKAIYIYISFPGMSCIRKRYFNLERKLEMGNVYINPGNTFGSGQEILLRQNLDIVEYDGTM